VFISRDGNPSLADSSAREGLIQGDEFIALKDFVLGFVRVLSSRYHEVFEAKKAKDESTPSPSEGTKQLRQRLGSLKHQLRSLQPRLLSEVDEQAEFTAVQVVEEVVEQIGEAERQIDATEKSLEELERQATNYRGLATIGIASTVFGHETQTAIAQLSGALSNAEGFLGITPVNAEKVRIYIAQAQQFSGKSRRLGTIRARSRTAR
jgi:hypothetical protein